MPQKYKQGEVYLVRFHPGYGSEFKKYRPAVILSNSEALGDSRFVLIAPFTSQTQKKYPQTEMSVKKKPFLTKDSLLLLWYVQCVDVLRLQDKLGELSPSEVKTLKQKLATLF